MLLLSNNAEYRPRNYKKPWREAHEVRLREYSRSLVEVPDWAIQSVLLKRRKGKRQLSSWPK